MGRKLLLDKAHIENIRFYDVYRREGGYRSVEKALKTMSPDAINGRSKEKRSSWTWWCRFSYRNEMEFFGKAGRVPRYLVVNADES